LRSNFRYKFGWPDRYGVFWFWKSGSIPRINNINSTHTIQHDRTTIARRAGTSSTIASCVPDMRLNNVLSKLGRQPAPRYGFFMFFTFLIASLIWN
jgi:hypothetical protein